MRLLSVVSSLALVALWANLAHGQAPSLSIGAMVGESTSLTLTATYSSTPSQKPTTYNPVGDSALGDGDVIGFEYTSFSSNLLVGKAFQATAIELGGQGFIERTWADNGAPGNPGEGITFTAWTAVPGKEDVQFTQTIHNLSPGTVYQLQLAQAAGFSNMISYRVTAPWDVVLRCELVGDLGTGNENLCDSVTFGDKITLDHWSGSDLPVKFSASSRKLQAHTSGCPGPQCLDPVCRNLEVANCVVDQNNQPTSDCACDALNFLPLPGALPVANTITAAGVVRTAPVRDITFFRTRVEWTTIGVNGERLETYIPENSLFDYAGIGNTASPVLSRDIQNKLDCYYDSDDQETPGAQWIWAKPFPSCTCTNFEDPTIEGRRTQLKIQAPQIPAQNGGAECAPWDPLAEANQPVQAECSCIGAYNQCNPEGGNRCGEDASLQPPGECSCGSNCMEFGNCCQDISTSCSNSLPSCTPPDMDGFYLAANPNDAVVRCNDVAFDINLDPLCSCAADCALKQNCCRNYLVSCDSNLCSARATAAKAAVLDDDVEGVAQPWCATGLSETTSTGNCSCEPECVEEGTCCLDYFALCLTEPKCGREANCGWQLGKSGLAGKIGSCACWEGCEAFENSADYDCCDDYQTTCGSRKNHMPMPDDPNLPGDFEFPYRYSCHEAGACGTTEWARGFEGRYCSCQERCVLTGTCCPDFEEACDTGSDGPKTQPPTPQPPSFG